MKKHSKKRTNTKDQSCFTKSTKNFSLMFLGVALLLIFGGLLINVLQDVHQPNEVSSSTTSIEEVLLETVSFSNYRRKEIYLRKVAKEFHDIDGEGLKEHLVLYMDPHGNRLLLNTREFNLSLAEGGVADFGEMELVSLSEKECEFIEIAKEHVIHFIQNSQVLKNKTELINQVQQLPFYKYSKVEHDVDGLMYTSIATYIDGAVYINKKTANQFCPYVATHEILHFICDLTNGNNNYYPSTNFDEAMTDALTKAINPCTPADSSTHSGYSILFPILYPYVEIFGKDAIYSYFYGFEELFNKYSQKISNFELEHDAFVSAMLGYLDDSYMSSDLTSQIIEKWRRELN